jgi:hypothetical protein
MNAHRFGQGAVAGARGFQRFRSRPTALFRAHGAPLVLKSDNGSAFISD